jgi:hypothetical protein
MQRASGIPCSLPFEGQRNANLGQGHAARTRTRICCLKLAVDTNAKPMLKIVSRDPDRNIIASAGRQAWATSK